MVFNDETLSEFKYAYQVEVYVENVEGYDGDGDLFQKFGVEIRDAATIVMAISMPWAILTLIKNLPRKQSPSGRQAGRRNQNQLPR